MKLIGIDYGHGETAAHYIDLKSDGDIRPLHIIPGTYKIYSAFYADNAGNIRVLNPKSPDMIELAEVNHNTLKKSFKGRISSRHTDVESICLYAKLVYEKILETNDLSGDHEIYIACPTNWSEKDAEEYLDLINMAGVPAKWVISEAYASLERYTKSIDSNTNVLIIDYGSSTIDFVAFRKGSNQELDVKCCGAEPNGANQVEIILSNSDILENQLKDVSVRDSIKEFKSRVGKEQYYENKCIYPLRIKLSATSFEPKVAESINITINDNQLNTITQFTDYKAEIKKYFDDLKYKLEDQDFIPDKVILTGSASGMDFVRSYAKSAFGDERIEHDDYPEYVVCHGIVEHARKYRKSDLTNHPEIKAHSNIYRALLLKLRLDDDINGFLNLIETHYAPEARTLRAICYLYGVGKKSPRKAFETLSTPTELDDYGKVLLAYLYYNGQVTDKDDIFAKELAESTSLSDNRQVKMLINAINGNSIPEHYALIDNENFILELFSSEGECLKHILKHLGLLNPTIPTPTSNMSDDEEELHVAPVSEELDYRKMMSKLNNINL